MAVLIFEVVLNATSLFNHGNVNIPAGVDRFLRWVDASGLSPYPVASVLTGTPNHVLHLLANTSAQSLPAPHPTGPSAMRAA